MDEVLSYFFVKIDAIAWSEKKYGTLQVYSERNLHVNFSLSATEMPDL